MKKFFTILCAIAIVLGANAAQVSKKDVLAGKVAKKEIRSKQASTHVATSKAIAGAEGKMAVKPVVLKAPQAKKEVFNYDLNRGNADVDWSDNCADAGWWQIEAENEDVYWSISNWDREVAAGEYAWEDLDPEYTCVFTSDFVYFTDGSCTVTVDDSEGLKVVVEGSFTGKDGNTYNVKIAYEEAAIVPGDYDFVAVKESHTYYSSNNDVYYKFMDADSNFIYFDIVLGDTTLRNVEVGKTYTLNSMLANYTKVDFDGKASFFSEASFVKTIDGKTEKYKATATDKYGRIFHMSYSFTAPEAENFETITSEATITKEAYWFWYKYTIEAADEANAIVLEIMPDDSYFGTWEAGKDITGAVTPLGGVKSEIYSGEVTIARTDDGCAITGKVLCYNNTEYTLNLTYAKPGPNREEVLMIDGLELGVYDGAWQLLGYNEDSTKFVSIAANYSETITGNYTDADLLADYTYVVTDIEGNNNKFELLSADLSVQFTEGDSTIIIAGSMTCQYGEDIPQFTMLLKGKIPAPEVSDMTFQFSQDEEGITVTPSNDNDAWDWYVINEESFEYYGADYIANALYSTNGDSYALTGEQTLTFADDLANYTSKAGVYYLVVWGAGSKNITTPAASYQFEVDNEPQELDLRLDSSVWGWGYNSTVDASDGKLNVTIISDWGAACTGWDPETDLSGWDKLVVVVDRMDGCEGQWFKLKAYLRDKSESEPNQLEATLGLDAADNEQHEIVIDLRQEKEGFDITKCRILGVQCEPTGATFTISRVYLLNKEYNITTASSNNEWGSTAGDKMVLYGNEVEISATPNYGYHFVSWNDGNTNNPRTITVTNDETYTATFAKNTYSIAKQTNAEQGYISGASQAEYLDYVTLTATPNYGYHFTQWSDGIKNNPRTIVLTQDTTFTAEFAIDTFAVVVVPNYPEWGTTTGDTIVPYKENVQIAATANYGYHFVRWNDGINYNPRTITVTKNVTYTAIFAKNKYYITAIADDTQGTVSGKSQAEYLDEVTLTAVPNYGYRFAQWSDGVKDNPRTFVLTKDTTFTALFAIATTGTCGDNNLLTWKFDAESKTLAISGNGALNSSFTFGVEAPSQTERLIIEEGVTSVGHEAFKNMATITSVAFPSSLTTIGNYAFAGLNNRKFNTLVLPNTIISIGAHAFDGALYLQTIHFGSVLEEIGDYAFNGCTRVKEMTCLAEITPNVGVNGLTSISSLATLNVPNDYLFDYQIDNNWNRFQLQALGATEATVTDNDVQVVADDNTATITWPTDDSADSYTIEITKDGVVFCLLTFNANGQLTGIAFAPSRDGQAGAPSATKVANGLQFTVTGLNSGTNYGYLIETKSGSTTVASYSGEFETTGAPEVATGIDDVESSANNSVHKLLHDGQLLILHNGKTYTIQGQEVK